MDDNKDNPLLRNLARLSPEEKLTMMQADFRKGVSAKVSEEDLKYYPEKNLRVWKNTVIDPPEVKRSYLIFDRNTGNALEQAKVSFNYYRNNPLGIGRVTFDKFGDERSPESIGLNVGRIKNEEDTLIFQGLHNDEDGQLLYPNYALEGHSSRLGRRLGFRYYRGTINVVSLAINSPVPERMNVVFEELSPSAWHTDMRLSQLVATFVDSPTAPLLKTLEAGPVTVKTPAGQFSLSKDEKNLHIKRLVAEPSPDGGVDKLRLLDDIIVPLRIEDPNSILLHIIDEPGLISQPFESDASFDHGWLHTDIIKALGVIWQPYKA